MSWPADIEQVDLRVVIVLSDGSVVEQDIRIDTVSGSEEPLASGLGRRSEAPVLFSQQLSLHAAPSQVQLRALGDALAN